MLFNILMNRKNPLFQKKGAFPDYQIGNLLNTKLNPLCFYLYKKITGIGFSIRKESYTTLSLTKGSLRDPYSNY